MAIHLPSDVFLVPNFEVSFDKDKPEDSWKHLEDWLEQLLRAVEDCFKQIRFDLELGTMTRRVVSSIPTESELEEGEVVFYESGSVRRAYTKINGSLRYWELS